jgi:hypothetical protein
LTSPPEPIPSPRRRRHQRIPISFATPPALDARAARLDTNLRRAA